MHAIAMLRRSALLLILLATAMAPVRADTVDEIDAAMAQWIGAFNSKSVDDIVALYAPDAVLFGTASPVLRNRPELVLDYFKSLPSLGDARITVGERSVQVFGDLAVSTGFYTRSALQDGKLVSNPARFTFVYARRNGKWLVVNHHSSALPDAPAE